MPTVSYASFFCAKDRDRALAVCKQHADSHAYPFHELLMIQQRCGYTKVPHFQSYEIKDDDYAVILGAFGIQYPDPLVDEWTHGWTASHYGFHHQVNHLRAAQVATGDYIVFSDSDCHMKGQVLGKTWIDEGIKMLEENMDIFAISPSDGRPAAGPDHTMSQQLFLINRERFLKMEHIPWDGKFKDGGPMAEYYFMLEGKIGRFMEANGFVRYVLGPEHRYWHLQWH